MKYLLLPCLKQSGCILFGMLECSLSPLGEGELHWISAQLENCPVSSSSAVKWTVWIWYSKLYEHRWHDNANRCLKDQQIKAGALDENTLNAEKGTKTFWLKLFFPLSYLFSQWSAGCKSGSQLQIMCEHERWPRRTHTQLVLMQDGIMGQVLDGCERAVDSGGLLQCSVGGNTQRPCSTGISRPDPMAHDTVVQRRLSAEPRTPFLHQMYS